MSISVWLNDQDLADETHSTDIRYFSNVSGVSFICQILIIWPESMTQFCQLGSRVLAENGSCVLVFAAALPWDFFCVARFNKVTYEPSLTSTDFVSGEEVVSFLKGWGGCFFSEKGTFGF